MDNPQNLTLYDLGASVAFEHALDRHERVLDLFHAITPALIYHPTLLVAAGDKARDSAERLRRPADLVQIHQVVGYCKSQLGDLGPAREEVAKALSLARELGDRLAQARAYAGLGQVARKVNDYQTGRSHLTKALALYREVGHREGEAKSLGDLGNLEDSAGNLTLALRHYGDALTVFAELGDWRSVATVHSDASIALYESAPREAVAHGLLAAAAHERAGDETRRETALWELASSLTMPIEEVLVDCTVLEQWCDSQHGSRALGLLPELKLRVQLSALASFDAEQWGDDQSTLISDPAVEETLRHAGGQVLAMGNVTTAIQMIVLADTMARARTVGQSVAAEEERRLRESLTAERELSPLTEAIANQGPNETVVDVTACDALRDSCLGDVADGLLQFIAGSRLLAMWQASETPAEVLEEAVSRLTEAAEKLRPAMGGAWWLETIAALGSALRHRLKGDRARNYETAIAWLGRCSEVPVRPETVTGHVACRANHANALLFRPTGQSPGDVEEAIRLIDEAMPLARDAPPQVLASLHLSLGIAVASRHTGDSKQDEERALSLYYTGLGIVGDGEAPQMVAHIHLNLGLLFSRREYGDSLDNEEAALRHLTYAVENYETAGWRADAAQARQFRANVMGRMARGDPYQNIVQAIAETREAIKIMQLADRHYDAAGAMNNLGNLYLDLADIVAVLEPEQEDGALRNALEALESSMVVRTEESLPYQWAQSAHNLATVKVRLSASDDTPSLADAICLYRGVLRIRRLHDMAAEWGESARALAVALLATGLQGDKEEAKALLETLVQAGESRIRPSDMRDAWSALGDIAVEDGLWPRAAECYVTALGFVESRLAAAVVPGTTLQEAAASLPLFAVAANSQFRSGDAIGCVLTLERSRARLLSEALERERRDLAALADIDPALGQRYTQAAARVRHLSRLEAGDLRPRDIGASSSARARRRYGELAESRRWLSSVEEEIRQVPGLSNLLPAFDERGLARLVEDRGPILYVWLIGGAIAVTACWRDGSGLRAETMVGTPDKADPVLDRLLAPDARSMESGLRTSFLLAHANPMRWDSVDIDALCVDIGAALPPRLWSWLQATSADRVTIVPCGPLALAPLHAAVLPASDDVRFIDRCTVAYAPSARTLSALAPIEGLLGRPVFHGDPTEDLPQARREVEHLGAAFANGTTYLGGAATRKSILESIYSADVVHFAGHGIYDAQQPLESGLVMADGILSLEEVLSWAPSADRRAARLMTLSACDTAVTDVFSLIDEAIGLASALLLAGVDGVIASLWPVFDDSTAKLMQYLYHGLERGLDPALALRSAQRQFRTSGVNAAAHWAPFIYVGS